MEIYQNGHRDLPTEHRSPFLNNFGKQTKRTKSRSKYGLHQSTPSHSEEAKSDELIQKKKKTIIFENFIY